LGIESSEVRRFRLIRGVADSQSPAIRYACFVWTFTRERALTWFVGTVPY